MIDADDKVFIATLKHGILMSPITHRNYTSIHPDGPLSNHVNKVDACQKKLWIVYGDYDVNDNFNPFPLYREGISSYQDGKWININYDQFNMPDLSFVKINPINPDEVYISSASKRNNTHKK